MKYILTALLLMTTPAIADDINRLTGGSHRIICDNNRMSYTADVWLHEFKTKYGLIIGKDTDGNRFAVTPGTPCIIFVPSENTKPKKKFDEPK